MLLKSLDISLEQLGIPHQTDSTRFRRSFLSRRGDLALNQFQLILKLLNHRVVVPVLIARLEQLLVKIDYSSLHRTFSSVDNARNRNLFRAAVSTSGRYERTENAVVFAGAKKSHNLRFWNIIILPTGNRRF